LPAIKGSVLLRQAGVFSDIVQQAVSEPIIFKNPVEVGAKNPFFGSNTPISGQSLPHDLSEFLSSMY